MEDRFQQGIRHLLAERKETMRQVVSGLTPTDLNRVPFDGAEPHASNSIAQLLSHALDAERFLVAIVAGVRLDRDRESHFSAEFADADALLALIDAAEREIAAYVDRITFDQLSSEIRIVEPTWPVPDVTQCGSYWLLHAVEHSSEHIGQALLTRQMYEHEHGATDVSVPG